MTGPAVVAPPSLEGILAQQANDAMKAGADPQKTTAMLGQMVKHLRANPDVAAHGTAALAAGADPGQVAHKVWELANQQPAEQPRVLSRVGSNLKQMALHPIDAITGMAKGAATDLSTIGENMNAGMGQPNRDTPEIAKALPGALARTGAMVAFPEVAGGVTARLAARGLPQALSKVAGTAAAGGTVGAVSSPDDPAAGAITGAIAAPALHGITKLAVGGGKIAGAAGNAVAGKAIDIAGRPAESGSFVEGQNDRAARLNAPLLDGVTPPDNVNKPLAPVDLGGIKAMREARGLKTSSPGAEAVLRDALQPRADNAVDRVIQHGLETTGLTSRENGLGVVDDMMAQRQKTGNATYQPLFEKNNEPLTNPEYDRIAKTHSGQIALKRGMQLASDRGEKIGSVTDQASAPPGIKPEDWANMQRLSAERGMPLPDLGGEKRIAPTLRQAHFMKLGFDDLINSGAEPGEGGSGPNLRAGRIQLKNQLLAQMDKDVPEYGQVRKVSADQADLVNGAKLGRALFKMHPQEAAKALAELPSDAQDVARRTGFDALSERIENGPSDIERGLKVRDRQRMRLLFPNDASFEKFQEGLKQEAQMHATTQGVLGGSNTADKLSDVADMAGVTLPTILKAASGHPLPLITKLAGKLLTKGGQANADALATARAKLLVAGANGDPAARAAALAKMGITPVPPRLRGLPAAQNPVRSDAPPASASSHPVTVELYRGARPGRGLADNPATGGATFASTDPTTGAAYATQSPDHVLHKITGTLDNPLIVNSLTEFRKVLGLPGGESQEQGIAAARAAGYDAIIHNHGKLVTILDNSKVKSEVIDHTAAHPEGSIIAKSRR